MKKTLLLMSLSAALFATSCKKDTDENPGTGSKNAKITVSVSSAFSKASGDDFSLSVGGATVNSGGSQFIDWKVDGKNSVGTITNIGSDYVNGGKNNVVVESSTSFSTGSATISSFNIGGEPFTINYKIEVNGKVVDEQAVTITASSDAFTKNYQL